MDFQVDGQRIFAYTGSHQPQAGQPAIVFVHGAAMDHSAWILQSRYFAFHQHNVYALDLPGHGRSDGKALPSITAMADWLGRFFTAADIDQALLVGHSMGSLAVLECAARLPERVRALALLATAVPMPVSEQLLTAAAEDTASAITMITAWAHSPASHFGGNPAPGLWMTGGGRRLLERAAAGVLHTDLQACNDYTAGLSSATKVQCPTLLVLGKRDLMTPPRAAQALSHALPQTQTVLLPGCGHMPLYERPDEVLDALIDFDFSR